MLLGQVSLMLMIIGEEQCTSSQQWMNERELILGMVHQSASTKDFSIRDHWVCGLDDEGGN